MKMNKTCKFCFVCRVYTYRYNRQFLFWLVSIKCAFSFFLFMKNMYVYIYIAVSVFSDAEGALQWGECSWRSPLLHEGWPHAGTAGRGSRHQKWVSNLEIRSVCVCGELCIYRLWNEWVWKDVEWKKALQKVNMFKVHKVERVRGISYTCDPKLLQEFFFPESSLFYSSLLRSPDG